MNSYLLSELFARADAGITVIPETGSLICFFATPIIWILVAFADAALSFLAGDNDFGFIVV